MYVGSSRSRVERLSPRWKIESRIPRGGARGYSRDRFHAFRLESAIICIERTSARDWVTPPLSSYDYERGLRLAIPTREKQLTPSSVSVVRRPLTAFGNGGVRSQPREAPELEPERDRGYPSAATGTETGLARARETRKTKVTAGSEYLWDKFSLSPPAFSRKAAAASYSQRRLKNGDESPRRRQRDLDLTESTTVLEIDPVPIHSNEIQPSQFKQLRTTTEYRQPFGVLILPGRFDRVYVKTSRMNNRVP